MIRCIIVDDSPLALNLLEDYIRKIDYLELVDRCTNALEAASIIDKGGIQLIFADIDMPDISGIQLVKCIGPGHKVIFTTAHSKYAVEGFNMDAVDYLLKPFPFERFKSAVEKVRSRIDLERAARRTTEYIYVRSGHERVKVNTADIVYIEALKDYVKIYLADKRKVVALISLKDISEVLPKEKFVRVHRSFIVSLEKVVSFRGNKIKTLLKEIPIGVSYRKGFARNNA